MNWHDYFTYDPETGILLWKDRQRSHLDTIRGYHNFKTRFAGKACGGLDGKGYYRVSLYGKKYMVHRVAYEMMYGPLLAGEEIDHINGNSLDNRACNIRRCTRSQNMCNVGKSRANTSGYKGVTRRVHKWEASIKPIGGKRTVLGFFNTPEEAHAAYCAAANSCHGEFARTT